MKIFARNKKAAHDYQIEEKLEAGIVLSGAETKSVKAGNASLKGAYVNVVANEAFLINAHIGPYKFAVQQNYEPTRTRKLLLKKSEIKKLIGKKSEKGLAIFPIEFYEKRGLVKLLVGLGRGKKRYEKRETLKKREAEREIARSLRPKS